jgi:hypothetical protein
VVDTNIANVMTNIAAVVLFIVPQKTEIHVDTDTVRLFNLQFRQIYVRLT